MLQILRKTFSYFLNNRSVFNFLPVLSSGTFDRIKNRENQASELTIRTNTKKVQKWMETKRICIKQSPKDTIHCRQCNACVLQMSCDAGLIVLGNKKVDILIGKFYCYPIANYGCNTFSPTKSPIVGYKTLCLFDSVDNKSIVRTLVLNLKTYYTEYIIHLKLIYSYHILFTKWKIALIF